MDELKSCEEYLKEMTSDFDDMGQIRLNKVISKNTDQITDCKAHKCETDVMFLKHGLKLVSGNIGKIEIALKGKSFWRCHRSRLVNIRYILEINIATKLILMYDGLRIEVSPVEIKLMLEIGFPKKFKLKFTIEKKSGKTEDINCYVLQFCRRKWLYKTE